MRREDCSGCGQMRSKGTTQVFRKLVFHFCRACWTGARQRCNETMQKA